MIRVIFVLTLLVLIAIVLLPFQALGLLFGNRLKRDVPLLFHRLYCKVIGIRITEVGARTRESPVLILANHVSWSDISVIGAVAPVTFVAKSEVKSWPVFGWLAVLQRTIFIERDRRNKTGEHARAMADRLNGGEAVLLFPEGTSSDGIRILPFRSALIGSVHQAIAGSTHDRMMVQPMSLAYTRYGGVPVGRALREKVAWYGDMDLMPHLLNILATGAVDVTVSWGEPIPYDVNSDRKAVAREAENAVRRMTARALRPPLAQSSVPPAAASATVAALQHT